MDITRRCDYAFRMMRALYLADGSQKSVSAIAEEEDIPYSFARSIQHELTKAGLIESIRGSHGGVVLAKDPATLSPLDLIEAMLGPIELSPCVTDDDFCDKSENCAVNKLWRGAGKLLREYFSSLSLVELLEKGAEASAIKVVLEYPLSLLYPPACAEQLGGKARIREAALLSEEASC